MIMRSAGLFVVLALVSVLAASSLSPVFAVEGAITLKKITTNGDTTTNFYFFVYEPDGSWTQFGLRGGDEQSEGRIEDPDPGKYTVSEEAGSGDWILTVFCEGLIDVPQPSTFEYVSASSGTLGGVIIIYVEGDTVDCTFTNSPAKAVGGVVTPTNTFALVAPWLAVIGLVGCMTIVIVVGKKRRL